MNETLTPDEIKTALAREYRAAQCISKRLREQAWLALTEDNDADVYKHLTRDALFRLQCADGILTAAEALGIGREELTKAAEAMGKEQKS